MKKITTIALMGLFTFSLCASNINNSSINNIALEYTDCKATITVDCDGDGQPEMEGTVNCEFAEALADQMQDAC